MLGTKDVDGFLAGHGSVRVDHDEAPTRNTVIEGLQSCSDLLRITRAHPEQRNGLGRNPGERLPRASLEEEDAIVEQAETGEPLPYRVEIGRKARASGLHGVAALEAIRHPHPGARQLVSLEKTAHEDRAAAAAGANIHEVAPDLLSADRFETSLQVIEANAAKLGVGKRLPSASRADLSTRQLAGMPLLIELAERPGHVSDRVCQLLDV
jgi:hypothetical protein